MAARDDLINTVVGLPVIGPAIGRPRVARFVSELEETVGDAARAAAGPEAERRAREGAREAVLPLVAVAVAAAGLSVLWTWKRTRK